MKNLIIAEKPSVAKDIARVLGVQPASKSHYESGSLIISSAVGHIAGLSISEEQNKAPLPIIPEKFEITALDGCRERLSMLSKLMKRSDVSQVTNCCDAGREGELIFYFLYECIGIKKPVRRMWLQSMTDESITSAYRELKDGERYRSLLDAARCRAESDWLVGINGSRALSSLQRRMTGSSNKVSIGRVQTPTLAMIVHRDMEIKNFVPQDYWEVCGSFDVHAGSYIGKWLNSEAKEHVHRFNSLDEVDKIIAKCQGQQPSGALDETKEQKSAPPKLFDLTTLQRVANSRFGYAAKKTLDIAQSLYEKHKVISYPRTDSNALPEDYLGKVAEIIGSLGASYDVLAQRVISSQWVRADKRIFDNKKISDHFAIIPTGIQPTQLSEGEGKVYDLVVRRFIASFYPAARYLKTQRTTTLAGEKFITHGRVLQEPGWLAVYRDEPEEDEENAPLVLLQPDEKVQLQKITAKALKTKPPAYYTEASLLSAMEGAGAEVQDEEARAALKGKGLGTPATRAAVIEGLKGKNYIVSDGKHLHATEEGTNLVTFLEKHKLGELTSPTMTGEWEFKLEQMAKGEYRRPQFMEEIAQTTKQMVSTFKEQESNITPAPGTTAHCPECGMDMYRRASKFKAREYYWACSGFPSCRTNLPDVDGIPGEKKQQVPLSEKSTIPCEKCGKPMVRRLSKFKSGEYYWACTGFPKCKATKEGGSAQLPTELRL